MQAAIAERVEQYLAALVAEEATNGSSTSNGSCCSAEVSLELSELILDGRNIRTISAEDADALSKFTNLSKLTFNQTGLYSLDGFPCMTTVRTLEATDNHITSGLEKLVSAFPKLKKLQLGGNHIKTFEDLEPLKHLTYLEQLGLDLNPVASLPEYRERVFALVPSLQILDSRDRSGEEREAGDSDSDEEEEDEEGEDVDTTLKDFYEGEMPEQDAEDVEDFVPPFGAEDEEEEIDEEEEAIEEDEDEDEGTDQKVPEIVPADAEKRKEHPETGGEAASQKAPRQN